MENLTGYANLRTKIPFLIPRPTNKDFHEFFEKSDDFFSPNDIAAEWPRENKNRFWTGLFTFEENGQIRFKFKKNLTILGLDWSKNKKPVTRIHDLEAP